MADLLALAAQHLDAARADEHGRSAELIAHDGVLRQTVIALMGGAELAEHNSPHAATIQVLEGYVQVSGDAPVSLRSGQLAVLTHDRHAVAALEDSVFLLTTVTGVTQSPEPQRSR